MYKSNDRLLLKPETIGVGLRDFMISIKSNDFPFSPQRKYLLCFCFSQNVYLRLRGRLPRRQRLFPIQFVPLLEDTLEKVKQVVHRVMPVEKKLSALEEAELEDDGGEGALEKEMFSQGLSCMQLILNESGLLDSFHQPCKHYVYIDQE